MSKPTEASGTFRNKPWLLVWEQAILPSLPAPSPAFLLFEFIIFTLGLLLAALDSLKFSSWAAQRLLKHEVHRSPADVPLPLSLL